MKHPTSNNISKSNKMNTTRLTGGILLAGLMLVGLNDLSAQNVGVGTTTPTSKLHVIHTDTGNAFRVDVDTTFVIIDSLGNLGVGVANPSSKLTIWGDVFLKKRGSRLNFNDNTLNVAGSDRAGIQKDIDGSLVIWNFDNTDTKFATNNQIRMTIDSGGNVGIGTNTPIIKFDVKGNGLFRHSSGNSFLHFNEISGLAGTDRAYLSKDSSGDFNLVNVDNSSLNFGTNNVNRMTILSGG